MAKISLDAMKACNHIKIKVHIHRQKEMLIRTWMAIRIMKVAALIGGFGWGGVEEITHG